MSMTKFYISVKAQTKFISAYFITYIPRWKKTRQRFWTEW